MSTLLEVLDGVTVENLLRGEPHVAVFSDEDLARIAYESRRVPAVAIRPAPPIR